MQKQTILITGAKGQIAQALAAYFDVTERPYIAFSKEELNICSLNQLENVFNKYKFSIIINCAGYTDTEKAQLYPEDAYETNARGVQLLANFARVYNKFLIHFSTSCIFDGTLDRPYKEDDIPNPLSTYGKSKYEGEKSIINTAPNYFIMRTSWAFSEFEGHNSALRFLRRASHQNFLKVVDDQYGCPTSAHSIAKAVGDMLAHFGYDCLPCGIFNFCSKEPTSWHGFTFELLKLAKEFHNIDIPLEKALTSEIPTLLKRPANSIFDTGKFEMLGFEIPDWRKQLKLIVEKIKSNQIWKSPA